MRELLEGDDEGCADEAAPIWVPRVVDYWRICWCTHGGLFGVDLVVAVPSHWSDIYYRFMAGSGCTIDQKHYDSALR